MGNHEASGCGKGKKLAFYGRDFGFYQRERSIDWPRMELILLTEERDKGAGRGPSAPKFAHDLNPSQTRVLSLRHVT